ncbi:cytochrome c biogenesis protein CcsA [Salinibaculum rarum]|uniref:cytochrome c biogenesis protein CcsA n=1 Tax=Salinibaculum rarum TaxID=3058903 RepID=UPI00265FF23F|nr:cytochrome c biogenesis protein CcsA [Salinibaculum sp. KK48]
MNVGTVLLLVAFLGGASAMATLLVDYARDRNDYERVARVGLGALSVGLVVALGYLTFQFATTDYSSAYVWENTADYLPLIYRLTGVYAANEGSILLWAAIASLVAVWAGYTRGFAERSTKLVQSLVVGFVTYLTGMLLLQNPFASVWTVVERIPPGVTPETGRGLNPLLVDPFMAIHPPVMFTSYALITMPFAIGVAHFVSSLRGDGGIFEEWEQSLTRWLRISWLFLTAAVALGAFWSYTVLGWGGIWAWDPVETAILVPWLFVTGTLHAVTSYRSGRRYTILAPAMTATSLALAVYTTSVVRSDVFRSVHSFASGGIGTSLLVLMGITFVLGVGLPFFYWLRQEGTSDLPSDVSDWLARPTLMHAAVLLFGLLTFVSLWGLTFPVLRRATTGMAVSVEARYYNLWSFPIVLVALLVLGFYMDYDVEGRRRSLVAVGVATVATVVAAAIRPSSLWQLGTVRPGDALVYQIIGQASALAVLPPVAYASIAVIKRGYTRYTAAANSAARRKEVGITMIHVSVALLVFSLPFIYLFAAQASVMAATPSGGSNTVDVPDTDYSLRVLDQHERQLPRDPAPSTYAQSSSEVLAQGEAVNESVRTVYGEVTSVRRGQRATVAQLNGSGLWVGVTGENLSAFDPQEGQTLVARGVVLRNFVPQTDAVVITSPRQLGTPGNLPASISPARVQVTSVDLAVYRDGSLVTSGTAGQRQYLRRNGMVTRDVLVERGLVTDTYVIVSTDGGQASITVKRIPFMTPIRLAVIGLLLGMGLVAAYDPRHGIFTTRTATETTTDSTPSKTD